MEQKGLDFAAIPQTAIKVVTSPAAFFREMPKTGGFVEPLIFALVLGVVGGIVQAIVNIIKFQFAGGIIALVGSIIFFPIAIAIGSFIGAAIAFVIWKILGSQESYETAYRTCAYLMALSPLSAALSILPYVGMAAFIVVELYYLVIASVEVHKIPSQKAWLVFGIIFGIFALLSITGEFAARKLAGELKGRAIELEKAAKDMEEAAKKMQEGVSKIPQPGQMTPEQQKQMEDAMKQMQDMMKNMPQKQEKE